MINAKIQYSSRPTLDMFIIICCQSIIFVTISSTAVLFVLALQANAKPTSRSASYVCSQKMTICRHGEKHPYISEVLPLRQRLHKNATIHKEKKIKPATEQFSTMWMTPNKFCHQAN